MIKLISLLVIAAVASSATAPAFATGEIMSNVSKTRSEISQTFARNTRG